MSNKANYMLGVTVGGAIGGYAPVLFGASSFSFLTVLTGAIGGIAGLWLVYKFING